MSNPTALRSSWSVPLRIASDAQLTEPNDEEPGAGVVRPDRVTRSAHAIQCRQPFRSLPVCARLVYVALDAVDQLYEHVRAAGGEIALELADTDYDSRDFTVRDTRGQPLGRRHLPTHAGRQGEQRVALAPPAPKRSSATSP